MRTNITTWDNFVHLISGNGLAKEVITLRPSVLDTTHLRTQPTLIPLTRTLMPPNFFLQRGVVMEDRDISLVMRHNILIYHSSPLIIMLHIRDIQKVTNLLGIDLMSLLMKWILTLVASTYIPILLFLQISAPLSRRDTTIPHQNILECTKDFQWLTQDLKMLPTFIHSTITTDLSVCISCGNPQENSKL